MQNFVKSLFQITFIIIITVIIIEIILQFSFLSLPQAIIQRMPQYPERYGIQFDTVHGAREYPANEQVNFEVNQFSGDLYQLSCLSPQDASELEPYQVIYTRDSHGFRNPEPWQEDLDLAIIGDSFTAAESIGSPYWENIPQSMLVLGLPGSGTLEQEVLLNHFALPKSPKTVILAYFGGNDLTDNLVFHELQEQNLTFADKTHQNRSPFDYLVSFHLFLFLRDALSQSSPENCIYPIEAQTNPPIALTFFDSMVSLLTVQEENLRRSEAYQITSDAIIRIANSIQEQSGKFILMYIPQKAEVYWQYIIEEDRHRILSSLVSIPWVEEVDDIEINVISQRNLLRELAEVQDFEFLDLTPELINAVENGESPYFFADTHWNQVGHDIANQVLIHHLAQSTLDKNPDS